MKTTFGRAEVKNKDRLYYPAVFTYEKGKEIAVVFPDFDVATSGVDDQDAFNSARECLGITIFGYEEDGIKLPAPTALSDIKVSDNERAVLVDVFMPSVRMANVNRSVSRTVSLPAWLNALALENNINFSQVLQDGIKNQLKI